MTNFYEFASNSPWLTFFLFMISSEVIFRVINRLYRVINIAISGWPPKHCDADGDFKDTQ